MPSSDAPESVTDIIFQVGLNDTRTGKTSDKICDDALEMQIQYRKKFRNARQHIMALPPIGDPQIELNGRLQKLANHTNSNYITTKALRDRVTGQLRKNLMSDNLHYNETGIKTISREIKKSLFSSSNIGDKELDHLCQIRENAGPPSSEISN